MENKKIIAMYIRLSDEDRNVDGYDKTESNSISAQRNLITSHIRSNGDFTDYEIVEYADM